MAESILRRFQDCHDRWRFHRRGDAFAVPFCRDRKGASGLEDDIVGGGLYGLDRTAAGTEEKRTLQGQAVRYRATNHLAVESVPEGSRQSGRQCARLERRAG